MNYFSLKDRMRACKKIMIFAKIRTIERIKMLKKGVTIAGRIL
jgi:hypothetical protein